MTHTSSIGSHRYDEMGAEKFLVLASLYFLRDLWAPFQMDFSARQWHSLKHTHTHTKVHQKPHGRYINYEVFAYFCLVTNR